MRQGKYIVVLICFVVSSSKIKYYPDDFETTDTATYAAYELIKDA